MQQRKKSRMGMYLLKFEQLFNEGCSTSANGCWNLDGPRFKLTETFNRVYAPRGVPVIQSIVEGTNRDQITVLACGNAAGVMLKPFILYTGTLRNRSRFDSTNDECVIGVNSTGTMDNPTFADYVKNHAIPYVIEQKVSHWKVSAKLLV